MKKSIQDTVNKIQQYAFGLPKGKHKIIRDFKVEKGVGRPRTGQGPYPYYWHYNDPKPIWLKHKFNKGEIYNIIIVDSLLPKEFKNIIKYTMLGFSTEIYSYDRKLNDMGLQKRVKERIDKIDILLNLTVEITTLSTNSEGGIFRVKLNKFFKYAQYQEPFNPDNILKSITTA